MKKLGFTLAVCALGVGFTACDGGTPLVDPPAWTPALNAAVAPDTLRGGGVVGTLDGGSGYGSGHRTCDSTAPC